MNVHISNLPGKTTEQDIKDLFAPYGEVDSVALIKDKSTGLFSGAAFVKMSSDMDAERAIEALQQTEYHGRTLNVVQADAADFPSGEYW